jgi:hypothetical protein
MGILQLPWSRHCWLAAVSHLTVSCNWLACPVAPCYSLGTGHGENCAGCTQNTTSNSSFVVAWHARRLLPSEGQRVYQLLARSGRLFWLCYSGFQPICHNIINEIRIALPEILLNMKDFSSIKLCTHNMTYPQRCFKQGIYMWTLPL